MQRFFFDFDDGEQVRDDEGVELPNLDAVREHVMRALPEMAYHEIHKNGDRQTFAVLVTDEDGRPVFTATLSYTGQWLDRQPD